MRLLKFRNFLLALGLLSLMYCGSTPEPAEEPAPTVSTANVGALNESLAQHSMGGFDYKSSALPQNQWTAWARSAAPSVKEIIDTMPEGHVLEVRGHACSIGPEEPTGDRPGNIRISRDRAQSVRNALVQQGVDATKMTVRGVGSSQPDSRWNNDDPRQRRVTFVIVPR